MVTTLVDVLDATGEPMLDARRRQGRAANGNRCSERPHRELAEQHGLMATQNAQVTALIHALRR